MPAPSISSASSPAWEATRTRGASVPVPFFDMSVVTLDLPTLIESKRAPRRPKDLAALPHIEAVLRTREAAEQSEG